MTDWTKRIDKLFPPPDGESAVRHRTGTVTVVNSDGTVDLNLGGVVVPSVAVLQGSSAFVGEVVQVIAWQGDLLVLGAIKQSLGVLTSIVKARTLNTTSTNHGTAARTVSVTVPIPADWLTYDVEIQFTLDLTSTSANNRVLTIEPQFDAVAVAGQAWAILAPAGSVLTFGDIPSGVGFFTGKTATGSRTASIVLTCNASDTAVITDDVALIATAYRTS